MKDKHGVTTQWFSLPVRRATRTAGRCRPSSRCSRVSRHGNKLRTGHLRGNRFRTRARRRARPGGRGARARPARAPRRARALQLLRRAALRTRRARTCATALAWLRGETTAAARARALPCRSSTRAPSKPKCSIATRSRARGLGLERLVPGEVVRLGGTGSFFVVEDPKTRFLACSPATSLSRDRCRGRSSVRRRRARGSSSKGRCSKSSASEREGAPRARRARPGNAARPGRAAGARRRSPRGRSHWIRFELPSGSYATEVLRELLRSGETETVY